MDNFIDQNTPQKEVNYACLPDFELQYSEDDLNNLSQELSAEEEKVFEEILELEKGNDGKTDFMKELLEAAKKGTMQYLDAMTDTGDTFSSIKRSDNVSKWDETVIEPINDSDRTRSMTEANKSALNNSYPHSTEGMSESGKQLFSKYEEAYSQRTKSLTQLSKDGNIIQRSDKMKNFETLSGLRGYRIGPVVPMPTAQQAKDEYNMYLKDNGGTGMSASNWLYNENMKQFDTELAKQLGFKSSDEAEAWRRNNKLTVHEGPDGMFMVPTDVHDAARHDGYRSMMSKYIKGQISEEEMKAYVRQEKVEYVKHETRERGTRMIKGIGLSAMKDVLKCSIVVICEETYNEFKVTCEDKFINRMLRIFKRSWEHVKAKCIHIIKNLWTNIKGSVLSEFLTALNDFFFGTFKKIFKVVRQMWGSIKNAFKIIFSKDKNISMGERMFEASKILSAGVVSIIGFSLNELIEKGLTSLSIPFASFISECLSGLFAGIMSAIVIMLFDKFKKDFMTKSVSVQKLQLESQILCIHSAQMQLSSVFLDMKMAKTYNFIWQVFSYIGETHGHIQEQEQISTGKLDDLSSEVRSQEVRYTKLEDMGHRYNNDENF